MNALVLRLPEHYLWNAIKSLDPHIVLLETPMSEQEAKDFVSGLSRSRITVKLSSEESHWRREEDHVDLFSCPVTHQKLISSSTPLRLFVRAKTVEEIIERCRPHENLHWHARHVHWGDQPLEIPLPLTIPSGSPRITLRVIQEGDLVTLARIANDERIAKSMFSIPFPYSFSDAQEFLKLSQHWRTTGEQLEFSIFYDGVLCGGVGLFLYLDNPPMKSAAKLGYWLGVEYWGKGIATTVATAMVKYATEQLCVPRIEGDVYVENGASRRVLEKVGLEVEGISRGAVIRYGVLKDVVHLGRLVQQ
eukprot:PhF_6_TR13250/c0_g1_i8/m.21005